MAVTDFHLCYVKYFEKVLSHMHHARIVLINILCSQKIILLEKKKTFA